METGITGLLKELEEFKLTNTDMWNVPPEVGRLLMILAVASRARSILEVGTSNGYSTIWLALAARQTDGRVLTVESEKRKIGLARENFRKAGLEDIVELREGNALEVLPKVPGPFDFVFIDAAKAEYIRYFHLVYDKVRPGGLIVADNAINVKQPMQDYLRAVRHHPGLESVLVPMGGGEEVSVKLIHPEKKST